MTVDELAVQACELAAFCARDVTWTQGTGGNVSFVAGETLWVKRSGARLRDMRGAADFLPLPREAVRRLLLSGDPDADGRLPRLALSGGGPPSVESFFHALLGPVTAHAHLVEAWVLADPGTDFATFASAWQGPFLARVPYAAPGAALGRAVLSALPDPVPPCGLLLLQNHGAIAWGPQAGEVRRILEDAAGRIRRRLGVAAGPVFPFAGVDAFDPAGTVIHLHPHSVVSCRAALQRPLTPDAALHMGFGLDAPPGETPALGHLRFVEPDRLLYVCASPETLENAVEIFAAQCIAWEWAGRPLECLSVESVYALLAWGAGKYGGGTGR